MQMNAVQSSVVNRIGYDSETRTVRVEFKNKSGISATWDYWPVAESDYEAVANAPSVGKAVTQYLVRGGTYNSRKVSNGPAPEE